ncbi:50S ribosomal protein L18 [Desulfofundulus thermobenzoicus]|uniref:Large ribosomal subunit protein uL18 n=1 Tax=Desulfofundulus thermobenzoicus TaxID=29376 RepID=A0A6N7ILS6_9FIRM|nr:50S ribosomal protein L18 [Desulfofundulus thermobenzoicus]MQL50930.1 50S ribosomal protein L18 [Desulfofundulus thermobenzoicus]HHW44544.1 50S ribosomal protein L18 [Desulfotomaculum sp.]
MIKKPDRKVLRAKRHRRVRKKIAGTAQRPRLNVFRSLNHIYAQIIDDEQGTTLISASSLSPELRGQLSRGGNKEAAEAVGRLVAQKALEKGIRQVVFDRAGYLYHGRVKALAEAAREAGLEF